MLGSLIIIVIVVSYFLGLAISPPVALPLVDTLPSDL